MASSHTDVKRKKSYSAKYCLRFYCLDNQGSRSVRDTQK